MLLTAAAITARVRRPGAAVSAGSVDLSWVASVSTATTGYRVYYGTAPGTYNQAFGSGISAGSGTSYTVTGLTGGVTYYFAVTAIDGSGESAYSTEASAVA